MGKHVLKIHALLVNPVILPKIVQILVALTIFVKCLDMVKDDLPLVLDLKDQEEWVIILMTMTKGITFLDIKEDLFIENLMIDLKDVDVAQVDLAVDLKDVDEDKGDLVADLKEYEAIFEMISTLQDIKIIQFWKMFA